MHLREMSHWHWTWKVWERVKSGLTGKVSEDIGQIMLLVNVRVAAILGDSNHPSVKLDAENQRKDGNPSNPTQWLL